MRIPLAVGLAATACLFSACHRARPLEDFGPAPSFQLTDEAGRPFDSRSLAGHVWVADFMYTTCTGPCPMMSARMRQIQNQTASDFPDVRLISITVDPDRDTPPVLAAYARHFTQDPARWRFLTGDRSKLNEVGLAFKLNSVDGSLEHSTRFVVVDRRGHMRGTYLTSEEGFLARLLRDVRQLETL